VDIQLRRVVERLQAQGRKLEVSPAAREALAMEGYDPVFGARPLKRVIQHRLLDPLSMRLLEGTIPEGATVFVDGPASGAPSGDLEIRA
jgi:ATP-dependent Clp protease ATP-binding subunit ClpB